ncbi:hypothetical protein D3C76_710150 [compost metagenome]
MKKITYVAALSCLLALGGCNEKTEAPAANAATTSVSADIQLPLGDKLTLNGKMTKDVTKPIDNGSLKTYEVQSESAPDATKANVDESFRSLGYVASEQSNAASAATKVHYHKNNSPTIGVLISDKTPASVSIYWQEIKK